MKKETAIELPEAFLERMREMLGEEYAAFLESYGKPREVGLRLNPHKVTDAVQETGELIRQFGLKKVDWAKEGYYYDPETRPGRHPFHEAGVYYIQEPSAMAVVELLDPGSEDRILDLCAAPGGKSTQAAGRLGEKGFLVSNEIHPARVKILSSNIERLGISRCVVTNESTDRLVKYFPEFFDKIIVDAPCSGEGMFRKDEQARKEWSPAEVLSCAALQGEILDNASKMLKPGGRIVYSTCTFAPAEDENSVAAFLKSHPDFSVKQVAALPGLSPGRPEWAEEALPELADTFRIWPHKTAGEGHYLAVLQKAEGKEAGRKPKQPAYVKDRQILELWEEFGGTVFTKEEQKNKDSLFYDAKEHLVLFGEQLYLIPECMPDYKGLRIERAGLHLGTILKKRFEPSHALALALKAGQVNRSLSLEPEGEALKKYLHGEVLTTEEQGENGWTLICAGPYAIGWGKRVGWTIKNHYPKGLRI